MKSNCLLDLRSEILIRRHKEESIQLAKTITAEAELFDELMNFFLGDENEIARHSAWLLGHCYDINPELFEPYLARIISNLENEHLTAAVKRNSVRVLQFTTIPTDQIGILNEICYRYLRSQKETIAVRVFCYDGTIQYRLPVSRVKR